MVPASKEWLGLYSDALLELTYAHNYEQVEPTDLDPETVANLCYLQYLDWLDSTCGGGDCSVPGFDPPIRNYRRNPTTNRIEWQNGDEWEEPTGDYAIPEPEARPESTDPLKKCGAASNAAAALKTLYTNILEVYDDQVEPLINQTEMAAQVALQWGLAFGPVSESFLAYSGFAWTVFTTALSEVLEDDWNEEFEEILVCILNSNATVTDGVVTFNFYQVNSDLVGFILPVIDNHVRVRWQVWYLLQCIGEQGLNNAGAFEAVSGDCVTCDTWCVTLTPEELGAVARYGWGYYDSNGYMRPVLYDGYYRLGPSVFVDTTYCTVTRVGMHIQRTGAGGNSTMYMDFITSSISNAVENTANYERSIYTADNAAIYSTSNPCEVRGYAYTSQAQGDLNAAVTSITIMGTGINPYGIGSNC